MDILPDNRQLVVRVLGTEAGIEVGGRPIRPLHSKKGKWLMALLSTYQGDELSRAWVIDRLWPGGGEESGSHSLRQCLWDLRQALGPEAERIETTARGLRFHSIDAYIDVNDFDRSISEGTQHAFLHAVEVYRRPYLEGVKDVWATAEREPRHRSALKALGWLANKASTDDRLDDALAFRRRAVSLAPLDEGVLRELMLCLQEAGDYGGVVDAYTLFVASLRTLDPFVRPSPTTAALYQSTRKRSRLKIDPQTEVERVDLVSAVTIDFVDLLNELNALKRGDFSARLRGGYSGVDERIAEAFNEIVERLEHLSFEFSRMAVEAAYHGILGGQAEVPFGCGKWEAMVLDINRIAATLCSMTRGATRLADSGADPSANYPSDAPGEFRKLRSAIISLAAKPVPD